jgi:hypothetical protein
MSSLSYFKTFEGAHIDQYCLFGISLLVNNVLVTLVSSA